MAGSFKSDNRKLMEHLSRPFIHPAGITRGGRLLKITGRAPRTTGDHGLIERPVNSNEAKSEASRREVRAGLEPSLARLWRYALLLSRTRDAADDLVQATCLRAIERADQFVPGTRVDRWLFAILRSIWLNDVRSQRIRAGGGIVDAEEVLTLDGAREIETNITASAVLRAINRLPEAQRETILLVYGEGYSYGEAATALGVPIGTIMSRLAAGRAALAKLK